jgi:hypothetical protein
MMARGRSIAGARWQPPPLLSRPDHASGARDRQSGRSCKRLAQPDIPPCARKLRIEDADFDAHTGLLTFKAQDKDWQYDGKTVTAADQAEADPAQGLLARRTLARCTGPTTSTPWM